ncbi:MAG TPA: methionyl-tRNA formyltransferase [Bryobacteraceae bacterium]|nr:methionyl-tRNA formyltransferase [Bryobacteraceae bacterium]
MEVGRASARPPMRCVFLGTPAFAVPTLEALVAAGHEVLCAVTQPDRPSGRGQQVTASPVKEAAVRLGLPVYQPERVRRPEAAGQLAALAPDVMVVVGYGQIIPQAVIDIPPHGIINVHASLLPKYRGAGPVQWAIANGETRTGVTTMRIDAGLDTGDMLLRSETGIGPDENAVELGARLAAMGAALLIETLERIASIVPQPQDPAQASYAPLLKREDGLIDWAQPAQVIHNRVRGFQPWPGAYTRFRGQQLHIWKSHVAPGEPGVPGRLLVDPLRAVCGEGALELIEVQLEGRKRIPAAAFANGQRVGVAGADDILGES